MLHGTTTTAAGQGPTINVWYGGTQQFGQVGMPMPMITVLGNVSSPNGVASLTCSLNGGPDQPLNVGPNSERLAHAGDFVIELPYVGTPLGRNQVRITARDNLGAVSAATVVVDNAAGPIWPLPYSIDWSQAGSINNVAQVTDGLWIIQGSTVRPVASAYDRLIAIGDTTWQDYEVTVPITVHSVDPNGYAPPANGPGVGLLLHWLGHSADGSQPQQGIYPLGGIGLFRWTTSYNRFEIFGNNGVILAASQTGEMLQLGQTYLFKVRVENVGAGTSYNFKWWIAGQPEPGTWQLTGQQGNDPRQGCLLLLAHYVDASFGSVSVQGLNVGALQVTLGPQEVVAAGAQWRRVNTSVWYNSGDTESGVPTDPYTVEFRQVSGWTAPAPVATVVVSGQTTTVSANYSLQSGSLQVALGPQEAVAAGAQWRRVNTSVWYNSGNTESGVPTDPYTVEFRQVSGWTAPDPVGAVVASGQTTTLNANYRLQSGSVQVTLTPAEAVAAGAGWRRVGTSTWYDSGFTETGVHVGTHAVEFEATASWRAPVNLNVTIANGQATTAKAIYVAQVGSLQVTITPQDAVTSGAQWRRVGSTTWRASGEIESGIPALPQMVEFSQLPGWMSPDPLSVMVRDQQTASAGVTYLQQFGTLQVTLSPAEAVGEGALWRREGTLIWHPSGYTEPDVPAGSQSVEFMSVPGWIAPTARDVVIFDRQPTMVQAAYSPEPGNLQVIIRPPEAVAADARWCVDGRPWMSSGTIAGGLAGGIHTVMFSDVAGFAKPAPQQVLIAASQTMIAIGIYRSNSSAGESPNAPATTTTAGHQVLIILTTDGVTAPAPVLYRTGTSVRVTAPEAPPGFVFDHWSGDLTGSDNPITVVMDRDMTLTANYVPADNTAAAAPPPGLCGLGIVEMSLAAIAGLATLPLCTRRRPHINGR